MQLHMSRQQNDKFVAFYREFKCEHESLLLFQSANMSPNSRRGRTVSPPSAEEAGLSAHTTEEANKASASKSAFGICEEKQEEKVYNKFHSRNSCDMLLKNGNGAEGWSMQLYKRNHVEM